MTKTQKRISKGIYKTKNGTYMARSTKAAYRTSATFKRLKDAKDYYNTFFA